MTGPLYHLDPRSPTCEPTITNAWEVVERGRATVKATFSDRSETNLLFVYDTDELSFTMAELIGLTAAEARTLRHKRDVAYLRS
ncbi:MAG TPA: hypothetical protein VF752_04190 [Thermoleophilaceae bacterium]